MDVSLEKLHDYLFCLDRKCFKELMEHSEDIKELLRAEDIMRKCSNLDRTSQGQGVRKIFNLRDNMNPAVSSSHEIDSNQSNYLQSRDEILCGLSIIWDFFHVLESKRIEKLCPSLHSFCQLLCEQGHMFEMLVTCLRCDDHFIAFQAHKIFREIAKAFSEIVVRDPLSELILSCLSKNKSTWAVLYTIEIIKDLLSFKTSPVNCDPKQERLEGCSSNCDCIFKASNLLTVNVQSVWNIVCQYWPALSKLCLDGVILLSDEIESEVSPNMQSGRAISQQILASFVSLGSILVQSCYHPTVNGLSQRVHILTSLELGFFGTVEDVNASMCHSVEQNCTETQNNVSKNIKLGGHEVTLSIFNSLQETVEKLVEIKKQEFSLHLRRAIMQFFNDVVDVAQQNSLNFFQRKSRHDIPDHVVSLCSFLLTNIDKLFWSLPKVIPSVNYFGGQDFKNKEIKHSNLAYDRVITRKVLLLVLKSALIISHVEKNSKLSNWKLLEDSIESWLNIVAKTSPLLQRHPHVDDNDIIADSIIVLFADQDDELMTVLQYILNIYQKLFLGEGLLPITQWTKKLRRCFNPHTFFLKFLHSFHYDHSLLLDFLISNETCFLPYFSSYLRHMANDWNGFVEIAEELHFVSAKSLHPLGSEYRNTATKDVPASRGPLRKNVFTNKTLFSENHHVAFLDLAEKYSNDITFLDCETRMEWSSENDLNHLVKDLNHFSKERKEVEVSVSNNSTNSALLSIMDDYADLSSGDSEDDFNEMENEEDDVHEVDRVHDDQIFKYHESYNINYEEDCCDDEDLDEDHDVEEDHNEDEDRNDDCDCDEDRDEDHHRIMQQEDCTDDCDKDDDQASDGVDDNKMDHLRNSLSCLIRLRFSIERMASKQLFPYPVQALVRLIKYIECLYEGD